jgi:hypothetical protein
MRVSLKTYNLKQVRAVLDRAKGRLDELSPVGKQVSLYLLSLVQRAFSSNSEAARKWEPLSVVTLFIRRHRASAPTSSKRPLNDKGLLRNSNFPFVRDNGAEFGVVNNAKYASVQNHGGYSQPSDVVIKNFARKTKTGTSKVLKKFYTMHLKGGKVEARPFFPTQEEFMPGVRRLMLLHVRGALGGQQGLGGTA